MLAGFEQTDRRRNSSRRPIGSRSLVNLPSPVRRRQKLEADPRHWGWLLPGRYLLLSQYLLPHDEPPRSGHFDNFDAADPPPISAHGDDRPRADLPGVRQRLAAMQPKSL